MKEPLLDIMAYTANLKVNVQCNYGNTTPFSEINIFK